MSGYVIHNTIAVNFKDKYNDTYVYFLTEIDWQYKTLDDIIAKNVTTFYTSEYIAKFMTETFKVPSINFVGLKEGESYLIATRRKPFRVIITSAEYSPGSISCLFNGEFGYVLYTGHCRINVNFSAPLLDFQQMIMGQELSTVYLDPTHVLHNVNKKTLSINEASEKTISLIWSFDKSKRIILASEEFIHCKIIENIVNVLQCNIYVSSRRYAFMQYLNDFKHMSKLLCFDSSSSKEASGSNFGSINKIENMNESNIFCVDYMEITSAIFEKKKDDVLIYFTDEFSCKESDITEQNKAASPKEIEIDQGELNTRNKAIHDLASRNIYVIDFSNHISSSSIRKLLKMFHSKCIVLLNTFINKRNGQLIVENNCGTARFVMNRKNNLVVPKNHKDSVVLCKGKSDFVKNNPKDSSVLYKDESILVKNNNARNAIPQRQCKMIHDMVISNCSVIDKEHCYAASPEKKNIVSPKISNSKNFYTKVCSPNELLENKKECSFSNLLEKNDTINQKINSEESNSRNSIEDVPLNERIKSHNVSNLLVPSVVIKKFNFDHKNLETISPNNSNEFGDNATKNFTITNNCKKSSNKVPVIDVQNLTSVQRSLDDCSSITKNREHLKSSSNSAGNHFTILSSVLKDHSYTYINNEAINKKSESHEVRKKHLKKSVIALIKNSKKFSKNPYFKLQKKYFSFRESTILKRKHQVHNIRKNRMKIVLKNLSSLRSNQVNQFNVSLINNNLSQNLNAQNISNKTVNLSSPNYMKELRKICPLECFVKLERIISHPISNKKPTHKNHFGILSPKYVQKYSNSLLNDVPIIDLTDDFGEEISDSKLPLIDSVKPTDFINNKVDKFFDLTINDSDNITDFDTRKNSSPVLSSNLDKKSVIIGKSNKYKYCKSKSPNKFINIGDKSNLNVSLNRRQPIVLLSDVKEQVKFLLNFELQPSWLNIKVLKERANKNRQCTLNKNYKE